MNASGRSRGLDLPGYAYAVLIWHSIKSKLQL